MSETSGPSRAMSATPALEAAFSRGNIDEEFDFSDVGIVLNDLEQEAEPYFISRNDLASQLEDLRATLRRSRVSNNLSANSAPRTAESMNTHLDGNTNEYDSSDAVNTTTVRSKGQSSLEEVLRPRSLPQATGSAGRIRLPPVLGAASTVTGNIIVGVACMDKKGKSKPMQAILSRLTALEPGFQTDVFGEEVLFGREPELWPRVDVLITFFSSGFPQDKALKYRRMHPEVFYVNDPESEFVLRDRGLTYDRLIMNHIPTARHIVVRRAADGSGPTVVESKNYIEVDGITLKKPFVEKPISGENHRVIVYHHEQVGGGSTCLFRKTDDNRCSARSEESNIRTTGSYIYEEYIETEDCQDVKVYAVGVHYAYAERRRSPVAGERVQREPDGREVRSVVELTESEREIAYKIVKAFNMNVCGFDLLRSGDKSFVCDINGWSFVKGNTLYYDQCAQQLVDMFRRAVIMRGIPPVRPGLCALEFPQRGSAGSQPLNGDKLTYRVLRGVIGVFRHGDRTPKQKLKILTSNSQILSFFARHAGQATTKQVKLKNTTNMEELQDLLDVAMEQVESGIEELDGIDRADYDKVQLLKTVLVKNYGGLKIQLKPKSLSEGVCTQLLLVCKWGGILTHTGERQAQQVGEDLRPVVANIRPGGCFDNASTPLHVRPAIRRESVQLMSNNERRVKQTALLVGRALLDDPTLDEDFIIDNDLSHALLDDVTNGDALIDRAKQELHEIMHLKDAGERPDMLTLRALVNKPLYTMQCVHKLMKELRIISGGLTFCGGEPVDVMLERWKRLRADFYNPLTETFNTSKIPDIFDYITHDVIHNQKSLKYLSQATPGIDLYHLFDKAERMARFLVPKEYGVRAKDRMVIGALVSGPLFDQVVADVHDICNFSTIPRLVPKDHDFASGELSFLEEDTASESDPRDVPVTRLYFSSESHLQTFRNLLIHSVGGFHDLIEPVELNYLCNIQFLVWENVPVSTSARAVDRTDSFDSYMSDGSLDAGAGIFARHRARHGHAASDAGSSSAPILFKTHTSTEFATSDPDVNHQEPDPAGPSLGGMVRSNSLSDGLNLLPQHGTDEDRFFVEVRFSAGASKNPWGIVSDHYNEVGPAITLHDSLKLSTLDSMQKTVDGIRSVYLARNHQ